MSRVNDIMTEYSKKKYYEKKFKLEKLKKVINNIEDENTEIARINQRFKYENEILQQIKNIMNNNGTIVDKFDKIKELVEKL